MSTVKINYSELDDASRQVRKAAKLLGDCVDDVGGKIRSPLQRIPGTDSAGHISSATDLVIKKQNLLSNRVDRLNKMSSSISTLNQSFKQHDTNVENNVNRIAYVNFDLEEWNRTHPFQAIAQWLYGTVCVDALNWNPVTKWIGDKLKSFNDWAGNKLNKVYEYFKYGQGRYILNIAASVITDVIAIMGAINAIVICSVATLASGGVAAPLLIAAIAAAIGAVCTLTDSYETISNNIKAFNIDKYENDPGRARFYADIDGVQDAIKKYDFGDESDNARMDTIGTAFEHTKRTAEVVGFVTGAYGNAGIDSNIVTGSDGKAHLKLYWNKDTANTRIKTMFKQKVGFENKFDHDSWSPKNLLKTQKNGEIAKNAFYTKTALNHGGLGEQWQKSEKVIKNIKKGNTVIKGIDKLNSNRASLQEKMEASVDIFKESSLRGGMIVKDIDRIYSAVTP